MFERIGLDFSKLLLSSLVLLLSFSFVMTRAVNLPEQPIPVQYHWLDSVNSFLLTGKLLMAPEKGDRVDPDNADMTLVYFDKKTNNTLVPLEEVAGGDDQGYPFIMSLITGIMNLDVITYGAFIKFNYLYLVIMGILASILIYLTFKSVLVAVSFYSLYLFGLGLYGGIVDHHWMLGANVIFYLSFISFFLKRRDSFRLRWFVFYFLVAGVAEIIRRGDGVIGILLLFFAIAIVLIQDRLKKYQPVLPKLILGAFLISIFILPSLLMTVVRDLRDLKYFGGKHSDLPSHHLLWHHAFIGLGYSPNPFGIKFDEYAHIAFLKRENPSIRLYSSEEDVFLRNLYFKYFWESPDFWFKNLFAKVKVLHRLPEMWLAKSPINNFFATWLFDYLIYISVLLSYFLSRGKRILMAIFWCLIFALFTTSLPALVVVPSMFLLSGYQAAFFMTLFYLVILLYLKLGKSVGEILNVR